VFIPRTRPKQRRSGKGEGEGVGKWKWGRGSNKYDICPRGRPKPCCSHWLDCHSFSSGAPQPMRTLAESLFVKQCQKQTELTMNSLMATSGTNNKFSKASIPASNPNLLVMRHGKRVSGGSSPKSLDCRMLSGLPAYPSFPYSSFWSPHPIP
jgi:hypothetical protein